MNYVIPIEPGDKKHGVAVPDLPGCFSAGDTLDEAVANAREAVELWLETAIDNGLPLPEPQPLSKHQPSPAFAGWIWAVIAVDKREDGLVYRAVLSRIEPLLSGLSKSAAASDGE